MLNIEWGQIDPKDNRRVNVMLKIRKWTDSLLMQKYLQMLKETKNGKW